MNEKGRRFRFDFIQEVNFDEENCALIVKYFPNPKRYEWQEFKGEKCLYDKFDNLLIPPDIYKEFFNKMDKLPLYNQPPLIEDANEYIQSRLESIKEEILSRFPPYTFEDKSEEFLESLKINELGFVILSLDIVNSTILSTELNEQDYARIIQVVLYEISLTVTLFRGHVLKYTGDGIIAYFPEPSYIAKHDLAIDCSLTIRKLIFKGINPLFEKAGLKKIDIRIGLESGNAMIITIGNPQTKQHKDIIGSIVNLACKIQSSAKNSDINISESVFQNLYTDWRLLCSEVEMPKDWKYNSVNDIPYKVFKVNL